MSGLMSIFKAIAIVVILFLIGIYVYIVYKLEPERRVKFVVISLSALALYLIGSYIMDSIFGPGWFADVREFFESVPFL